MLEKLLQKLGRALHKSKIPYMIIGGQAVLLHGESRLTKDIDLTLGIGPDEFEKIASIAEDIGLKILVKDPEEFAQKTFVLPAEDPKSGFRVDFVFSVTPYEKQAIQKSISRRIGGVTLKFASLEDLIIHKIFAGRARDIEDVKGIISKNSNFDKSYIRKWLKEFDKTLSKDLEQTFQSILDKARIQ